MSNCQSHDFHIGVKFTYGFDPDLPTVSLCTDEEKTFEFSKKYKTK